ncbi:serine hydrolase [Pedobacter sp. SYSU D00535]|uniref:serine hydrolase domain-containing protein n=1 Tax=Pedobacter sp. SYSU D00535 TaxID=2810308 RepID=UPI001A96A88F|nr:serine hydrolase domain-containing protein [Pedobacter sp. SYSU D00535]
MKTSLLNSFSLQLFRSFFAMLIILKLEAASAQDQQLKQFEGTYQLTNNKAMFLKIIANGDQLILKQGWDNKEIAFRQSSPLSFLASQDSTFPLDFEKDEKGVIVKVTAFKRDVWEKTRLQEERPSPAEVERLKESYEVMFENLSKAVNSDSPATIEALVRSNVDTSILKMVPTNELVMQVRRLYRHTGGIDAPVPKSFSTERGEMTFKARDFGNNYAVNLALSSSGKILHFGFRETSHFQLEPRPATPKELVLHLKAKLDELAKKDLFSGTVLLAQNEKVLLKYVCGEADKEKHIKNNTDTKFSLGSMNKMFTAVSIMQLAEKGYLQLDAPISNYLDSTWLPLSISRKVTVHHLLSHTSGLGDFLGDSFDKAPAAQFTKLEGFKPFVSNNSLQFEPGSAWSYSNSGMVLLGAVIESVSKSSYFDYVRRNIYQPSGMKNTDVFDLASYRENIAIGYIPQANGYTSNLYSGFTRGSSAGGGYSTIEDMHQFALALTGGKLLSSASLEKLFHDYKRRGYGYGFQLWNTRLGKAVGHSGGAPGVNGLQFILPDSGYTIVVLANYDRAAQELGDYILWLLKNIKH